MKLCLVGRIREALDEDLQRDLDLMLSHPERYSTRVIARALTQHGHEVRKDAIHTHRKGDCRCPR